jgi:hypothetical protein
MAPSKIRNNKQEKDTPQNISPKVADRLIKALFQIRIPGSLWIQRKETAAWVAAALYLTGFFSLVGIIIKTGISDIVLKIFITLFLVTVLCCIVRFIQIQYGEKADEVALQYAVQVVVFKLIYNKSFNLDQLAINIEKCESLPRIIEDYKKLKLKGNRRKEAIGRIKMDLAICDNDENDFCKSNIIRKYNIPMKMIISLLPFWGKKRCSRMEREEAYLYDMLVIPTVLVMILFWLDEILFLMKIF